MKFLVSVLVIFSVCLATSLFFAQAVFGTTSDSFSGNNIWSKTIALAKTTLVKFFIFLIELGKKIIFWLRDIFSYLWQWLKSRGGAIKQGFGEERQELKEGIGGFLKFLPKL
jgi:hypothetical protein